MKIWPIITIFILSCGSILFGGENKELYQEKANNITGQKIAFIKSSPDGYYGIYIAGIDNIKNAIQITFDKVDKRTCEISADRQKVVYTTNEGKIYIMGLNNIIDIKEIVTGLDNCSEAKWARQNTGILFTSYPDIRTDDADIWLYNLENKKIEKITNLPWLQNDAFLSDSGETLYYINGPEFNKYELCRMDMKTHTVVQITQKNSYITEPAISPSGEDIAFSADFTGNYKIWMIDRDGEKYKQLTTGNTMDTLPKWNGNSEILYLSKDKDTSFIMAVNIDTGEKRKITDGKGKIIWFSI